VSETVPTFDEFRQGAELELADRFEDVAARLDRKIRVLDDKLMRRHFSNATRALPKHGLKEQVIDHRLARIALFARAAGSERTAAGLRRWLEDEGVKAQALDRLARELDPREERP
jgi:hypothetical protein